MDAPKPPFYDNKNRVTAEALLKVLDVVPGLDDRDKQILGLIALNGPEDGVPAELAGLADQVGVKVPALRSRLKRLVSSGLVEHAKVPFEGGRRPGSLFRLQVPNIASLREPDTKANNFPTLPEDHEIHALSTSVAQAVSRQEYPMFVDHLFCGILFSALPVKRNLTYEPVHVDIDWYGHKVPVTLRPLIEKAVCTDRDLRFYIGLITYLTEIVQNEGVPLNVASGGGWVIRVSEILRSMAQDTSGGNVGTAIKAFERLAATSFEIEELPEQAMSRLGVDKAEQAFQALSNFGVYQRQTDVNSSTFITFTLPPAINDSLIKFGKDFFKLHPSALRFNDNFFLRVHLWAKRRLGAHNNNQSVDLVRAWKEVAPGTTYNDFLSRLNKTLNNFWFWAERQLDEGAFTQSQIALLIPSRPRLDKGSKLVTGTFNMFGYIIRVTDTHVHITRDISDPYVGNVRKGVGSRAENLGIETRK